MRPEQPCPRNGVDVGGQRQRRHVRLQALDHRSGLGAGTGMAGAQADLVARFGLLCAAKDAASFSYSPRVAS